MDCDVAACRATCYGIVARGFRYPGAGVMRALAEGVDWAALLGALNEAESPLAEAVERVWASVRQWAEEPEEHTREFQADFGRLFGHSVRGTCPPYELEYDPADINQQAALLADISGFYEAFGLMLAGGSGERADHICVECEFMAVLAAKEGYAGDIADADLGEVARRAQRHFLKDHLGRWVPAFAMRLEQADADSWYGRLGRLALATVAADCRRAGVECGPGYLQLQTGDADRETHLDCGVEESCPGACGTEEPIDEQLVQLSIGRS